LTVLKPTTKKKKEEEEGRIVEVTDVEEKGGAKSPTATYQIDGLCQNFYRDSRNFDR
jgi:hypothetical protein